MRLANNSADIKCTGYRAVVGPAVGYGSTVKYTGNHTRAIVAGIYVAVNNAEIFDNR